MTNSTINTTTPRRWRLALATDAVKKSSGFQERKNTHLFVVWDLGLPDIPLSPSPFSPPPPSTPSVIRTSNTTQTPTREHVRCLSHVSCHLKSPSSTTSDASLQDRACCRPAPIRSSPCVTLPPLPKRAMFPWVSWPRFRNKAGNCFR